MTDAEQLPEPPKIRHGLPPLIEGCAIEQSFPVLAHFQNEFIRTNGWQFAYWYDGRWYTETGETYFFSDTPPLECDGWLPLDYLLAIITAAQRGEPDAK